ncbi:MAG: VWA domain-containing protein [Vicinamibacterales bacterium]|nr:VWA domain-containing protein [Vicinamibacterales bacterium]
MTRHDRPAALRWRRPLASATAALVLLGTAGLAGQEGFRFRSGVELVNVTATVTDRAGRFVSGLRLTDFVVRDDGEPQEVTHFNSERVPVSLGIVLDTSGSMAGDRMAAARDALDRFLLDLLRPDDEVFVYRFSTHAELVQEWTTDRREVSRRLGRLSAAGGTALYDAVAEAAPMAQSGRHRKKALLVISDGNDTNSRTTAGELARLIRETEVLVYAIGIDARGETTVTRNPPRQPPIFRPPIPNPFPIPGGGGRRGSPLPPPQPPMMPPSGGGGTGDRVNVSALRAITDDSGGRTEIIRAPRDLDPATRGIADELSQQYYLGYPSPGHRDNRWHTIDVSVTNPSLRVRARRGYVAAP